MGRSLAVPPALLYTDAQKSALIQYSNRHTTGQQQAKRARIILRGFENTPHSVVGEELSISVPTVKTWRKRWESAQSDLSELESMADLERAYEVLFKDRARSGRAAKFTKSQKEQIVALPCDKPCEHGVQMTDWTHEMLAQTAQAKSIVDSISSSQVGRILKKSSLTTSQK